MVNPNKSPRIGDVYMVRLTGEGSEQLGLRPCLVFQNNVGNTYSPNLIVLPLTSSMRHVNLPTHVFVRAQGGLRLDSVVICENPVCVSKSRIGDYVATLSALDMRRIAAAQLISMGGVAFMDESELLDARSRAIKLNTIAS